MNKPSEVIQIDLQELVRRRLGRYACMVPRFLVRWLEKTVCQKQLNELLRNNFPKQGADFCEGVLNDLDVKVDVKGSDKLPPADMRRVLIVCNHPLGGLDGMALIEWATRRYGGRVHFIVNDLLNAVEPLRTVFVPVNKHGGQSRDSIKAVDRAFASDDPVLVFPAGLCSRRGADGKIADLQWQKMFVNKAIEYQRPVVPLYFDGRNSDFFYKIARIRNRLGLKFNFEMIYLPREVFRAAGSRFSIICGETVDWKSLRGGKDALAQADEIRTLVYTLANSAG